MREAIESAGVDADIQVLRDGHAATKYFDAVETNQNRPCPDLILLDMNLPKLSGGEVLEHLRAGVRCRDAKVLIVSSADARQAHAALDALHIDGYFKKPSNYAEFMKLGSIIKDLLEMSPQAG